LISYATRNYRNNNDGDDYVCKVLFLGLVRHLHYQSDQDMDAIFSERSHVSFTVRCIYMSHITHIQLT
jgi:hypothetical protein